MALSQRDGQQVLREVHDPDKESLRVVDVGVLVPEEYDHLTLTYVTVGNGIGEIETVVYREGGASGTVVATLTLAYDGSDRLSTVTRS